MTTLTKGANTSIAIGRVQACLTWTGGAGGPDIDGSALLLGTDGRVSSDDDFVFYNQARHPSGTVRHLGKSGTADTVEIDLAAVPSAVDRVVLAASADGGTFGSVRGLLLTISDASGAQLAEFAIDGGPETAMLTGELYRRDGQWKFRAVGQGYASGLAGLATDFGISVDDAPPAAAAPAAAPAATPSAQPPAFVPPPPPPGFVPPPFPGPVPMVATSGPAPTAAPTAAPATAATLDSGRVSLLKGDRVSLVKSGAAPLARVVMGLGWDPATSRRTIDLDASVIAFDAAGKRVGLVWFTHLKEFNGALIHAGDNLTGQGEGDDEQIHVDLQKLPGSVSTLVFTITSYRGHRFTEVRNAFCRLVDATSGQELVRYNLSESEPATGVIMASLRRTPAGPWEMRAIGEFHDGRTVKKLLEPAARYTGP